MNPMAADIDQFSILLKKRIYLSKFQMIKRPRNNFFKLKNK